MRVATIDIGTNTTLMLVAELRDGELVAVEDHAEITRLGRGVDRTKRIDAAAMEKTLATLRRYAERARALSVDVVAAVATSASRDASNGEEFRTQAAAILGGEVQIVSGAREAMLTFQGALGGLGVDDGARVAVIDVGGGSTEVVVGTLRDHRASIAWSHSYDIGSVRMTERHVRTDPPRDEELATIASDVQSALSAHPPPSGPFDRVVAIAGTATTYAAIELELADYATAPPHGHRLALDRLNARVGTLAALPLEARRRTVGLLPDRADVIVAGGIVLARTAEALGADALTVSDRGVRWGLAHELAIRGS